MIAAICQCTHLRCPLHRDSPCPNYADTVVFRIDMPDIGGIPMCQTCAANTVTGGLFCEKGIDLIEPGDLMD